jgi:general stress protein 26
MQIDDFSQIADDFLSAVHSQVWCNVATVDRHNRPRSRVLHPIWENDSDTTTGWIATGRTSLKAKHLEHNPHVSVAYLKDPLKPVYIDAVAAWVDEPDEKRRVWTLLQTTPPPLGYDPTPFFGSVESLAYGLLKLMPTRIELADLFGQARVWRRG